MNVLAKLGKTSIIYGLGGAITKGIPFLLLPVYTNIFTPEEYGTIEIFTIIIALLSNLMMMGMDSAQSYFFFEQNEDERPKVVSSIVQWRFVWGGIVILISTFIAPFLNSLLFNTSLSLDYFVVAFVISLFSTVLGQAVDVFRLTFQPWHYIAVNIFHSTLTALLILFFILILDKGIFGFLLGMLFASLICSVFGLILIRHYLNLKQIHFEWFYPLIKFGLPLLPMGISFYLMNFVDRWFIQYFEGPSAVGIYAVAAQIALIVTLVIETFRKGWWPVSMEVMHKEGGKAIFRMIARIYIAFAGLFVISVALASPFILEFMSNERFYSAKNIILILVWPPFLYGFYMISSAGLWKNKRTDLMLYIFLFSCVLNFFLNYILVPTYGGIGAAISTLISFVVLNLLSLYLTEKLWNIRFEILTHLYQLIVLLLMFITSFFLSSLLSVITYIGGVVILFFLTFKKEERIQIRLYASMLVNLNR